MNKLPFFHSGCFLHFKDSDWHLKVFMCLISMHGGKFVDLMEWNRSRKLHCRVYSVDHFLVSVQDIFFTSITLMCFNDNAGHLCSWGQQISGKKCKKKYLMSLTDLVTYGEEQQLQVSAPVNQPDSSWSIVLTFKWEQALVTIEPGPSRNSPSSRDTIETKAFSPSFDTASK